MTASYTVEVDWGTYLELATNAFCGEEGIGRSALFAAVGAITGDRSRTTIAKLLAEPAVPDDPKARNRAVVLLLALGVAPENFELDVDADLTPSLRALGPARVRNLVRREWAARDSNPEPAD